MKKIIAISLLSMASAAANASTLFFEDFETGLGQWTDTYQGNNAQIVHDPLSAGTNYVMNFSALRGGGDLFSTQGLAVDPNSVYTLSFDYLGTCQTGNCGGFIGISSTTGGGSHAWLGGTTAPYPDLLPDTGAWEQVSISFKPGEWLSNITSIHLMLEDWSGSGGIAGDAFFDNIMLTDANGPSPSAVPVPAAAFLFAPALLGFMGFRRKLKA